MIIRLLWDNFCLWACVPNLAFPPEPFTYCNWDLHGDNSGTWRWRSSCYRLLVSVCLQVFWNKITVVVMFAVFPHDINNCIAVLFSAQFWDFNLLSGSLWTAEGSWGGWRHTGTGKACKLQSWTSQGTEPTAFLVSILSLLSNRFTENAFKRLLSSNLKQKSIENRKGLKESIDFLCF